MKAAPSALFLCTGRGTFLFLSQEKKKCGAQAFPPLPREDPPAPLRGATAPLFQEEKNPHPAGGQKKGRGKAPSLPHTPLRARSSSSGVWEIETAP